MLMSNYSRPPIVMDAGSNVSSSGSGATPCGNPGTTGTPGATASGGLGALTYLWEQIGTPAQSGPYNCSNTAILNPTWTEISVCDGDFPTSETWRLTVTDDTGQTATDTITVTLTWTDLTT